MRRTMIVRACLIASLLWPSVALADEWSVGIGPVLPWQRDHQQTSTYRSWTGSASYQWTITPWLRGGIAANGMLFRFPDTDSGVVVGVGPLLTPHYDLGGGWSVEVPIGAGLSWNNIYPKCIEVSTSLNALLHAGLTVRYQSAFAELRWQHLSNAHTHAPNIGMDWIVPMIGVRF